MIQKVIISPLLFTRKHKGAAIAYASAMRCSTPRIRKWEMSFENGKAFNISPIRKINNTRLIILPVIFETGWFFNLSNEYAIAVPTIKRKNGKIKSVGVHPCQSACLRG